MPSVGVGEQHLQRGPMLLFKRTHNSATMQGSKLRGVINSEAQPDLDGVILRPLGNKDVSASMRMAQAAQIVIGLELQLILASIVKISAPIGGTVY